MMAPAVTRQPEGPSSPGGTSARSDDAPAARIAAEEVELRRLAVVVDSSADAILSKDRDCRITSWNRGAERLYGYAASGIVGQNVSVLVPADHSGEEHAILDRLVRGDDVGRYETQRLAKDGSVIDVSITVSPISGNPGEVIGASSIHRDITEQRRAREQLRAELLDLVHDAVIVRDPADSRVTFPVDHALAHEGQWVGELRHTRKDGRVSPPPPRSGR
jgi:PAS domain S-box-containing protein